MKKIARWPRPLCADFYFKPLAAALAILLALPPATWISGGHTSKASATPVVPVCTPQSIFQCSAPNSNPPVLSQLETDAVHAYLALHGMSDADASIIYTYGRSDLRTEIRAAIFQRVLQAITLQSKGGTLSGNDSAVLTWFQPLVTAKEQQLYQFALNEFHSWATNACTFQPDPGIVAASGMTYDASGFCNSVNLTPGGPGNPPVPSENYFLANAEKHTYGVPFDSVTGALILTNTALDVSAAIFGTAAALTVPAALGGALGGAFTTVALVPIGDVSLFLGTAALGAVSVFAAVLIPLIYLAVGIVALVEDIQFQQQVNQLSSDLNAALQKAQAPSDLNSMSKDPHGSLKLEQVLLANTLPEFTNTTPLPSHRSSDPAFNIVPQGQTTGQVSTQLTYQTWGTNAPPSWTATPYGNWFIQNGTFNSQAVDSITPTLHIIDWSGNQLVASATTNHNFIVSKTQPASTDHICEADSITQVTQLNDLSNCTAYVTSSIQLTDGNGNHVTVSIPQPPAFTSNPLVGFTETGSAGSQTFNISANGNPLPNITLTSGPTPGAPSGAFVFSDSNTLGTLGSAHLQFNSGLGTTPGNYTFVIQAASTSGLVTQTLTATVGTQVSITSPNTAVFDCSNLKPFVITTTGSPPPAISTSALVNMQLTDNHNGTATLSYQGCSLPVQPAPLAITVTAANNVSSTQQHLTIQFVPIPPPQVTSQTSFTFVAGAPNTAEVVTSGGSGTISFTVLSDQLPWLNHTDTGHGTLILSGTPPASATGQTLTGTIGVNQNGFPQAAANLSIAVIAEPVFTNPSFGIVTEATHFDLPMTANFTPTMFTFSGQLPPGMHFISPAIIPSNVADFAGTVPTGNGGDYPINVTAQSSQGPGSQIVHLYVLDPPVITSYPVFNFTIGQANTTEITTTGWPRTPIAQPFSSNGMAVTATPQAPLPAPLQNALSFHPPTPSQNSGTLVISGDPPSSALGTYHFLVTANNGVGTATQNFTLNVIIPGDLNADGVVNCTDISLIRAAYGSVYGGKGYDPRADANNDGIVNLKDLLYVSQKLPTGTVCH